jgi:hypothetical protein
MVIYKYPLPWAGDIQIPHGAAPLSVGVQNGDIVLWARVNPNTNIVRRRFPIYGTGHQIHVRDMLAPLIGTCFDGDLVWHVFDAGEISQSSAASPGSDHQTTRRNS